MTDNSATPAKKKAKEGDTILMQAKGMADTVSVLLPFVQEAVSVKKNGPAVTDDSLGNTTAARPVIAPATDFEERFIKADVVNWQKLLEAGAWGKARELGWLHTEGKQYVVQDGDVIEFKV